MDNFILNKKSGRPMKIGGKSHRRAIITRIRDNAEIKTILTDINMDDYKKLKKSLPRLSEDKFYYYDPKTKIVITKNKSIKPEQLIKHICDQLPNIIDRILNEIDEKDNRDITRSKMIDIFHQSIL